MIIKKHCYDDSIKPADFGHIDHRRGGLFADNKKSYIQPKNLSIFIQNIFSVVYAKVYDVAKLVI
jgi:hypothetical protein